MNRTLIAAAALVLAVYLMPRATAQETPAYARCIHIAAPGEQAAAAARMFMDRQITEGRGRFITLPAGADAQGKPLAGVLCAW